MPCLVASLWFGPAFGIAAADVDVTKLPPPAETEVDFDRDIKPILDASCTRCHGGERPKARFRLEDREGALKGGAGGVDIVPGDSARSPLAHYVAQLVPDMEMPPPGKGEALTPEQVGLLRAWIDQGVKWSASPPAPQGTFTSTQGVQWITVQGNERKFREDTGQKEGWSGGVSQFAWRQPDDRGVELTVQGRGIYDQSDYGVSLTLKKRDLGFVRVGYDNYRQYFNDVGGFYPPYNVPPPRLDRDLYLDVTKAWWEAGLTLPDLPKITVGYEYQAREGNRATLQWGQYSPDPTSPVGVAIFPNYQDLDEHVHLLRLDVSHDLQGLLLEDNLRVEFYDLGSRGYNQGYFSPFLSSQANETYEHTQVANTLRAESQLRDWLWVSAGYLYTHLEGDASFRLTYSDPSFPADGSDHIALEQHSHTANANALFGPWAGWSLSTGVQGDWQWRNGLTVPLVPPVANPLAPPPSSRTDRTSMDERVGLRYDRIPYTVVRGDARLRQEWCTYSENGLVPDVSGSQIQFVRDTRATRDVAQYGAGFTVSPWPTVSFESGYQHDRNRVDYDQRTDWDESALPGNGYPAFVNGRRTTQDEFEAKLVLRPASWLKATLRYQLDATEYRTSTASATNAFVPSLVYPGGEIVAGNENAHVYRLDLTLTPWRRLYLAPGFSYSDSYLMSGDNDGALVVPYRGHLYGVLCTANYIVSSSTDVRASYTYSQANYDQEQPSAGVPYGLRFDRHGVLAGVTRRFKKNVTTSLQYGFFRYREPTAAGANDYTAHAVIATFTFTLP